MIKNAMEIRQKSDYDDFYIASRAKAEEQLDTAERVDVLESAYTRF